MKKLLIILVLSLLTLSTAVSQSHQRVVTAAPVDTIEVVCHDLELNTDFLSLFKMAYIFANNSEYELTGAINNVDSIPPGTYTDCFMDLKHIATQTKIPAVSVTLTLAIDANRNCVITGQMLGEDNICYNLHLSWTPPVSTETVHIAFDNSASVAYYPDLEHDFMLVNQNDAYEIGRLPEVCPLFSFCTSTRQGRPCQPAKRQHPGEGTHFPLQENPHQQCCPADPNRWADRPHR